MKNTFYKRIRINSSKYFNCIIWILFNIILLIIIMYLSIDFFGFLAQIIMFFFSFYIIKNIKVSQLTKEKEERKNILISNEIQDNLAERTETNIIVNKILNDIKYFSRNNKEFKHKYSFGYFSPWGTGKTSNIISALKFNKINYMVINLWRISSVLNYDPNNGEEVKNLHSTANLQDFICTEILGELNNMCPELFINESKSIEKTIKYQARYIAYSKKSTINKNMSTALDKYFILRGYIQTYLKVNKSKPLVIIFDDLDRMKDAPNIITKILNILKSYLEIDGVISIIPLALKNIDSNKIDIQKVFNYSISQLNFSTKNIHKVFDDYCENINDDIKEIFINSEIVSTYRGVKDLINQYKIQKEIIKEPNEKILAISIVLRMKFNWIKKYFLNYPLEFNELLGLLKSEKEEKIIKLLKGISEKEKGISEKEKGISEKEKGISEKEKGISGKELIDFYKRIISVHINKTEIEKYRSHLWVYTCNVELTEELKIYFNNIGIINDLKNSNFSNEKYKLTSELEKVNKLIENKNIDKLKNFISASDNYVININLYIWFSSKSNYKLLTNNFKKSAKHFGKYFSNIGRDEKIILDQLIEKLCVYTERDIVKLDNMISIGSDELETTELHNYKYVLKTILSSDFENEKTFRYQEFEKIKNYCTAIIDSNNEDWNGNKFRLKYFKYFISNLLNDKKISFKIVDIEEDFQSLRKNIIELKENEIKIFFPEKLFLNKLLNLIKKIKDDNYDYIYNNLNEKILKEEFVKKIVQENDKIFDNVELFNIIKGDLTSKAIEFCNIFSELEGIILLNTMNKFKSHCLGDIKNKLEIKEWIEHLDAKSIIEKYENFKIRKDFKYFWELMKHKIGEYDGNELEISNDIISDYGILNITKKYICWNDVKKINNYIKCNSIIIKTDEQLQKIIGFISSGLIKLEIFHICIETHLMNDELINIYMEAIKGKRIKDLDNVIQVSKNIGNKIILQKLEKLKNERIKRNSKRHQIKK